MGLERITVLFALEQRLGIQLPDDVISVRTVGELHDVVVGALHANKSCPTAAAFYRIRRGLIAAGVPRGDVRPSTPLARLLPDKPRRRRKMWQRIARFEPCLPAPNEGRSRLDSWMLLGCSLLPFILVPLAAFFAVSIGLGAAWTALVMCIPLIAIVLLGPRASFPLCHRLPPDLRTVGDLARAITCNGSVLDTIRCVIAEECIVKPDDITPETDLALNLGI